VSAVGTGINTTYGNLRNGADALAARGIAPAGVATSSFRITWMVPRDRVDDAVRALHERLVVGVSSPVPSEPA
jgi:aspartate kinase